MNLDFFAYRIGFLSKKLLLDIIAHKGKTPTILNVIFSDKPSFGHLPIVHLFSDRQDAADAVLPGFCFGLHKVPSGYLRVYLSHRRTLNLNSLNILYFRNNGTSGFIPTYTNGGNRGTRIPNPAES
jgi:hypothetical protein